MVSEGLTRVRYAVETAWAAILWASSRDSVSLRAAAKVSAMAAASLMDSMTPGGLAVA